MAEPLKTFFDPARIHTLADELAAAWPPFPRAAFIRDATTGLDALELMPRGRHIATAMTRHLPAPYPAALDIVLRSLRDPLTTPMGNGMAPFHTLPHTLFVAQNGLHHPDLSIPALRHMTKRFSCEFAIRPYLDHHTEKTFAALHTWTHDEDEHVRRLVSEGTRPRLPWAPRLAAYDPHRTLPLLHTLRDDPSDYVRRSVANHLNDISKDDPTLAIATSETWLHNAPEPRRRLIHHALRTLVRAGHPTAIRLTGGTPNATLDTTATLHPTRPHIGDTLRIHVTLTNPRDEDVTAVLGIRIHYIKKNGTTSPKTFKLPTTTLTRGQTTTLRKTISLAQQTTREHHPGEHNVDILVNGQTRTTTRFTLQT